MVGAADDVLEGDEHGVVGHDEEGHEEHEGADVLFEDDAQGGEDVGNGDAEGDVLGRLGEGEAFGGEAGVEFGRGDGAVADDAAGSLWLLVSDEQRYNGDV